MAISPTSSQASSLSPISQTPPSSGFPQPPRSSRGGSTTISIPILDQRSLARRQAQRKRPQTSPPLSRRRRPAGQVFPSSQGVHIQIAKAFQSPEGLKSIRRIQKILKKQGQDSSHHNFQFRQTIREALLLLLEHQEASQPHWENGGVAALLQDSDSVAKIIANNHNIRIATNKALQKCELFCNSMLPVSRKLKKNMEDYLRRTLPWKIEFFHQEALQIALKPLHEHFQKARKALENQLNKKSLLRDLPQDIQQGILTSALCDIAENPCLSQRQPDFQPIFESIQELKKSVWQAYDHLALQEEQETTLSQLNEAHAQELREKYENIRFKVAWAMTQLQKKPSSAQKLDELTDKIQEKEGEIQKRVKQKIPHIKQADRINLQVTIAEGIRSSLLHQRLDTLSPLGIPKSFFKGLPPIVEEEITNGHITQATASGLFRIVQTDLTIQWNLRDEKSEKPIIKKLNNPPAIQEAEEEWLLHLDETLGEEEPLNYRGSHPHTFSEWPTKVAEMQWKAFLPYFPQLASSSFLKPQDLQTLHALEKETKAKETELLLPLVHSQKTGTFRKKPTRSLLQALRKTRDAFIYEEKLIPSLERDISSPLTQEEKARILKIGIIQRDLDRALPHAPSQHKQVRFQDPLNPTQPLKPEPSEPKESKEEGLQQSYQEKLQKHQKTVQTILTDFQAKEQEGEAPTLLAFIQDLENLLLTIQNRCQASG